MLESEPLPDIQQIHIHLEDVTSYYSIVLQGFLTEVANESAPSFCVIFQASLNQGMLPEICFSCLYIQER